MSALGQKQTRRRLAAMSPLPAKADIGGLFDYLISDLLETQQRLPFRCTHAKSAGHPACSVECRCSPLAKSSPEPKRARRSGRPLLPFRRIRKWREHPSPSSPGSSRHQTSCLLQQRRVPQRRRPYHQGALADVR